MPTVESAVIIQAPLEHVYAIARDIERFPEFMPDVVEVKIIERTEGRQLSRWVAMIKEFNRHVRWTEEDIWDDEARVCLFRQTVGDYSQFGGSWRFHNIGGATEVSMQIDYDYNVPLIGSLIRGIIYKKMQQNVDGMLGGLKQRAEETWGVRAGL